LGALTMDAVTPDTITVGTAMPAMALLPALQVDGLVKRFGALVATAGVSMEIAPGELRGLIGPNGAGKTTFINQVMGELRPSAGRIRLAGRDVTDLAAPARARLGLARSFQIPCICRAATVLGNAALAVRAHRGEAFRFWCRAASDRRVNDAAAALLDRVGLGAAAGRAAGELSHGEQRRLELAMALAGTPRVLLLDEPMAGMSPEDSQGMVALLAGLKGRCAILLVEHDMDAVFALADRISVLVNGGLVCMGTPEEVRQDAGVRAAYLGEEADGC
jgi:branched-chain amino acid transport system ATP-binding protein